MTADAAALFFAGGDQSSARTLQIGGQLGGVEGDANLARQIAEHLEIGLGKWLICPPGRHGEFDLWSLGADGQPGGEGVDADLGNWNAHD